MKIKLLIALLLAVSSFTLSARIETPTNPYQQHFSEAYEKYPTIPKGMLEAVAFTQSRFHHMQPTEITSCVGLPNYHGVMGLVDDGKNYFRSNLSLVEELSKNSKSTIKSSARNSILSYAKAYSEIQLAFNLTEATIEDQYPVLVELSELPNTLELHANYALNSHLYAIYFFLDEVETQRAYGLPERNVNFEVIFGDENYRLLSSHKVLVDEEKIYNENGDEFYAKDPNPCNDYAPALWVPADPSNYSSRNGSAITAITIHDMEGPYSGAIAWFQNPSANACAHYNIRAVDGQITQMVCEIDKAWHVGSPGNNYAVGIEHEGFADYIGWYTETMYQVSADLCRDIMNDYSINSKRCYSGESHYGVVELGGCTKIKGHQHFPNVTHRDPGLNWNWPYFYTLLNDDPQANIYTNANGTFYDSGGSNSNYIDDERDWHLFEVPGATSISLNFTSFDLEEDWDYMWIYDGNSIYDPLIGVYTGANSPGTIVSSSDALLVEFRSDCATEATGWEATYTSSTTSPACGQPNNLVSNPSMFSAMPSWDVVPGASEYVLRYKHIQENNWTVVTTNTNSYQITGIGANTEFYWQVAAICGTDTSAYNGEMFVTPAAVGLTTLNACSGDFRDSGGNNGQYINNQDWTYVIAPGTEVTVDFTMFDVEADYDFLYAYDGSSTAATQFPGSPFHGTSLPAQLISSGDGITFRFTSDNRTHGDGWEATWSCNGMIQDTIKPTTVLGSIMDPVTDDFTLDFTDEDNVGGSGVDHIFYQVADTDGSEWRANNGNGFFNDDFDNSIHSDWIDSSGVWAVTGGYLAQTDEANGNTNLFADCDQNNASKFLYHFKTRLNGTGGNRRAGFHYMCDDASQTERGNSYFIWYRLDDAKLQFYKVVNNSFSLEKEVPLTFNGNQWYDVKVVYDKLTGKTEVWWDDEFIGDYVDANPYTVGNQISFRSGNCIFDADELRVYKTRTNSELITVGQSASDDIRYQGTPAGAINSIAIDSAKNVSTITTSYVNVDLSTGVEGISQDLIQVFPNPFSQQLNINFGESKVNALFLYDVSGRVVQQQSITNESKLNWSTEGLSQGTYLLKVVGEISIQNITLIKQ